MTINYTDLMRHKNIEEVIWRAVAESNDNLLYIRKFGRTGGLSTGTTYDLWYGATDKTLPETSAATVSIVSTSANDTLGGTGANYLKVSGLDADYNHQTEIVTLNGTTPVATSNTYITINRAYVAFSGSGKTNAGDVTGTINSNKQFTVPAGDSITQQSHFTVPAGYTLLTCDVVLTSFRTSGTGTRHAEITQYSYSPDSNTTYASIKYGISTDSQYVTHPRVLTQAPAKTTLWFKAAVDANNTGVTSSVGYLMIKNNMNLIDF